jgi:TPP-dependent pyruvate/acetoin dehydrogenase alpha subunit
LSEMLLIRRFEEKAAEAYALGKIGGFLHLYIGEEAVAVGATRCSGPTTMRSRSTASTATPTRARIPRMMAGSAGATGPQGQGRSMHLFDRTTNFSQATRSSGRTCRSRSGSASPSSTGAATR